MVSRRPTVVVGILGGRLDAGQTEDRWSRWRPTVSVCQHEDLVVDRFELIHLPAERDLAAGVARDIGTVSPETVVTLHEIAVSDPWDFEEVFASLHGFARSLPFRTDDEDYLVHITTGTHVQQICLFLLAESRHLPGRILQSSPPRRGRAGAGLWRTIDLDLSRYDSIAARFALEQREDLSFLKSGIDTRSPAFNALIGRIERVAVASPLPILLTGPTGAGKSTLLSLVARYQEATAGTVSVDGVDVRAWDRTALRRGVAVVFQETFLFSATVAENIAFGRPDAPREDVERVARAARADGFIRELAKGYDTVIGERGVSLSGGQRQRIAIARALLTDPRIVLLDDATSAIDPRTEHEIQEAMAELCRGRTTFVVAHRLSTVRRADRILLLDGGRLVASGTHASLMSESPLYRTLFAAQTVEGDAEGSGR